MVPRRCVVQGCSNVSSSVGRDFGEYFADIEGFRAKCLKFAIVKLHRKYFIPVGGFAICSQIDSFRRFRLHKLALNRCISLNVEPHQCLKSNLSNTDEVRDEARH